MVGTVHTRFSTRTLDDLAERLARRRDAIAHCLESLQNELTDAAEHRDCSDLLDESPTDDSDLGTDRLLVAQAERALASTESALSRMAEGSYGVCLRCARPIPLVRLRALPDTVSCVECSRQAPKHAPEHENWDDGWTSL